MISDVYYIDIMVSLKNGHTVNANEYVIRQKFGGNRGAHELEYQEILIPLTHGIIMDKGTSVHLG